MNRFLIGSAAGHILMLWACAMLGGFPGMTAALPIPAIDVYLLDGAGAGRDGALPSGPAGVGRKRAVRPDLPAASIEPPVAAPRRREPVDPAVPASAPAQSPLLPAEAGAPSSSIPRGPLGGVDSPAGSVAGDGPGDVHAALKGVGGDGEGGRSGHPDSRGTGLSMDVDRSGALVLLRERIQSRLVYPSEALRRGLEGEVVLRIWIETGGIPREILIARSSGARVLDVAARRGVVDASPLPTAPGWIEVPVRFRLR